MITVLITRTGKIGLIKQFKKKQIFYEPKLPTVQLHDLPVNRNYSHKDVKTQDKSNQKYEGTLLECWGCGQR